ncbi:MAG: glycoside hydrolase family 16 protein [Clostridiaceae bacterium]|jgi:beta-glucanase (GH16 family)|nr:glycoside hydrolase family 16 protein [Clostridiaceae bacterium]
MKNFSRKIMRRIAVIAAAVLTAVCLSLMLAGCSLTKLPDAETLDLSGMEVVFADNFDGSALDLTKWKINTMPSENGIRRAGYYTDTSDIIFVADGALTIRTKFKDGERGEGWYTSWLETGIATSKDIDINEGYKGFNAVGGYFEVRCIAPPSVGIWSAFWLMPDNDVTFHEGDVQWTAKDGLEVDVMESPNMYQSKSSRESVTHVLHSDGYGDKLKSSKSATYKVPKMYSEFHRYGVMWTKTEWIFYIDGRETWRTEYVYEDKILGVSEVAEYLILSVEVGGSSKNGVLYPGEVLNADGSVEPFWSGNPDKNDKGKAYDFIVDYVKVWQTVNNPL